MIEDNAQVTNQLQLQDQVSDESYELSLSPLKNRRFKRDVSTSHLRNNHVDRF